MKTILTAVGGLTVFLFFLGAVGFGNFILKFSTDPIACTEVKK